MTKKCNLSFTITSSFIDEEELDVVPLDICGIVLSPYLYDRKAIFSREENNYHVFKDGIEFNVRDHKMKTNLSMVTIGKMKMLINASNNLSLMSINVKGECDPRNEVVKCNASCYPLNLT